MELLWETKYIDGIMRVYEECRTVSTPRRSVDIAKSRIFIFEPFKTDNKSMVIKPDAHRIKEEIRRLNKLKICLPEYSKLGTPNHLIADIQIDILNGRITEEEEIRNELEEQLEDVDEDNLLVYISETTVAFDFLNGECDELIALSDINESKEKKCSPTPCRECPFRKTAIKGWLGDSDHKTGIADYEEYIMFGTPVNCHMNKEDFCKGMIHFMNNKIQSSKNPDVAALQREWKDDKENQTLVFNNTLDFFKHHKRID